MRYKKISQVSILIFLTSIVKTTHALGVCENETSERDKFRNLTAGFSTASVLVVKLGMSVNSWLGLTGIIPGLVANNHFRIWQEKENNLSFCLLKDNQDKLEELNKQKFDLVEITKRNQMVQEINDRYDKEQNEVLQKQKERIHKLTHLYILEGRDIRDQIVQDSFRDDLQLLKIEFDLEIQRIRQARELEINVVLT